MKDIMAGVDLHSNNLVLALDEIWRLFKHRADQLFAREELRLIRELDVSIDRLEEQALKGALKMPEYESLLTIPGIGKILGMTIALETGDPKRSATAGDFASYCRTVRSERTSNGKKKSENNAKCGNKYLVWAFVEAANFAVRYDSQAQAFYERKKAKTNTMVATKALACKLSKSAWHVMRKRISYDDQRVFGPPPGNSPSVTTPRAKGKAGGLRNASFSQKTEVEKGAKGRLARRPARLRTLNFQTRRRSGCTPAEPYPPLVNGSVRKRPRRAKRQK